MAFNVNVYLNNSSSVNLGTIVISVSQTEVNTSITISLNQSYSIVQVSWILNQYTHLIQPSQLYTPWWNLKSWQTNYDYLNEYFKRIQRKEISRYLNSPTMVIPRCSEQLYHLQFDQLLLQYNINHRVRPSNFSHLQVTQKKLVYKARDKFVSDYHWLKWITWSFITSFPHMFSSIQ